MRKRKEMRYRYLNQFFFCLHGCHDMDVERFIECNPKYSPQRSTRRLVVAVVAKTEIRTSVS